MLNADDDLVRLLHEGVFEAPPWSGFLAQLRARTGAACTSLQFGPAREGAPPALSAGAPGPPVALPFSAMREGRVYSREDLADFHGDSVQLPGKAVDDRSDLRTIRVAEPGGIGVWLSWEGPGNLGPSVGALISALAPHLRTALRAFATLERERMRSAVAGEAVERMRLGWIALDARCTILEASAHAEEMFKWGTLLRKGRYDRLVPASPAVDRRVTELVKRYAASGEGKPEAFTLSHDPWCDMLVAPAARRSIAGGLDPVAIAYVSGDRRSQADRGEQLGSLFGLLPSEARFAWVLAQSASIPEAAQRLGLTVETARNYSKKVYSKTGARGHAELVRIVLTSVMSVG